MAEKTISQSPKITDTIVLEIATPDANGCFTSNPYKVDNLVIYYVERNFATANYGEYDNLIVRDDLVAKAQKYQADYCANPSDENKTKVDQAQLELTSSAEVSPFYYNNAKGVEFVGNDQNPAWLSTDTPSANLSNVSPGRFEYRWNPSGKVREGSYFACWTWTPNPAGDKLSDNILFTIDGDPRAVTTIPSHVTPEEKYDVLLERYLPEVYKAYLSYDDITPETLQRLNLAVAKGFKGIEDLANQMIDLLDANALHESLLVYLSNLFHLRLKSNDPTLWRRQIKEAVPLFKKKGTIRGLYDAFAQSGVLLNKVTKLWQVVSRYTWQESFLVEDVDNLIWQLTNNVITPVDVNNFEIAVRKVGQTAYTVGTPGDIQFIPSTCGLFTNLTYIGADLTEGDIVRILYQYNAVPTGEQTVENFIRLLPLADLRDERTQRYPLKNWNVRVIGEDDPMFDVVIPVKNPYHDSLVFGKIRTEFPYSENIYNMEEYNGSTRESGDPCDIDKDFIDPCGDCQGSKYNLDIGVEDLSDDRMQEVHDILREYVPFHAFVHSIDFVGEVNEFITPPVEQIECLIQYQFTETVLSGDANPFFHRVMTDGRASAKVDRNQAAHLVVSVSGQTGTAYNDHISLIAPDVNLERVGVKPPGQHVFTVLAPSPNAGSYQIQNANGHVAAVVSGVTEPVNGALFTFQLSNVQIISSTAMIVRSDEKLFKSAVTDFVSFGVTGQWDVMNVPNYSGGVWQLVVSGTTYNVYTVLPDGSVVLVDPGGTLPATTTSGLTYTLLDPDGNDLENMNGDPIGVGTDGVLTVEPRGDVNLNASVTTDDYVDVGDYLLYGISEYRVVGIEGGHIQIDGYAGGSASGVTVQVRRRLADNAIGYFGYAGLRLTTAADHESGLGMLNGDNPPTIDENQITDNSMWKENFLVLVGSKYYKIAEIDGANVILAGEQQDWGTLNAGGTIVNYAVHHFVKDTVEAQFMVFDQVDRDGKDPVVREILSSTEEDVAIVALGIQNQSGGSGVQDFVRHDEGISFTIEYRDGSQQQGEIV